MILKPIVDVLMGQDVLSCVEVHDCIWMSDNTELHWNTDNNREDLFEGDGDTYHGYIKGTPTVSDDGYVVFTVEDGTGYTIDMIMLANKEVD